MKVITTTYGSGERKSTPRKGEFDWQNLKVGRRLQLISEVIHRASETTIIFSKEEILYLNNILHFKDEKNRPMKFWGLQYAYSVSPQKKFKPFLRNSNETSDLIQLKGKWHKDQNLISVFTPSEFLELMYTHFMQSRLVDK